MKITVIKTFVAAFILAAVCLTGAANADHSGSRGHDHSEEKKEKQAAAKPMSSGNIVHVRVKGLVCDFCARSIRKVFLKTGAVEDVDVNLKRSFINIYMKKRKKLSDKKISKLVNDAGYSVESISFYKKEGRR